MQRVEVYKPTQDDWYGNYRIENDARVSDLVHVSFMQLSDGTWRTCVWGNDDCGMEFDHSDETTVWNMFLQVIGWPYVNRQPLKDLGFVSA